MSEDMTLDLGGMREFDTDVLFDGLQMDAGWANFDQPAESILPTLPLLGVSGVSATEAAAAATTKQPSFLPAQVNLTLASAMGMAQGPGVDDTLDMIAAASPKEPALVPVPSSLLPSSTSSLSQSPTYKGSVTHVEPVDESNGSVSSNTSLRPLMVPFPVAPPLSLAQKRSFEQVSSSEDSTGSPAVQTPTQKKQQGQQPAPEEVLRRQRHNNIEIKRRKQLNDQFEALQKFVKPGDQNSSTSQADIVSAAVQRLREFEDRVRKLELEKEEKITRIEAKEAVKPNPVDATTPIPKHYHAFLNSGVAMSVALMNGQIVEVNESFADMMKNTRTTFSQLSMWTITANEFKPKCYEMMNDLLTSEDSNNAHSGDLKLMNCQGKFLSVHATSWVVREDGKPKYIMAMLQPLEVEPKDSDHYDPHQQSQDLTPEQVAALPCNRGRDEAGAWQAEVKAEQKQT